MGRKNTVNNFAMFGTAGCNLATASTSSNVSNVQNQDNIGIIISWTGSTPVGTLAIEASNDQLVWDALDFGSAIAISGNSGSHNVTINQFPWTYLRATYTKTSGTGTLFASLTSKQMGG